MPTIKPGGPQKFTHLKKLASELPTLRTTGLAGGELLYKWSKSFKFDSNLIKHTITCLDRFQRPILVDLENKWKIKVSPMGMQKNT